ncbi:DUF4097 family beta strand repeat-containing protein [Sinomicrobium weinanense]|uniref:DUF4097 family beta strand repeat protein n=1 Tax=Sinomicrobium weinanense TaxID=2842200 RepID=A0A926JW06_9FLAO|nr:DUF4097 family beta strand repeat-containing protein [Sinomicrobium weinanense]MBC9798613.1 DUF4097 family beta strand repeat protein [Sinomicrobium weinanense]MBU3124480.1 DUF4097 domain-containing protein [Sinomicrobium weinanense]
MKYVKTLFITCLLSIGVNAQEYTAPLQGVEWIDIESKAEITIKSHGKNTMVIRPDSPVEIPEKAKGLRLVADGVDNTGTGFSVTQHGNRLMVKNLRKQDKGKAVIYLPASQNISVHSAGLNDMTISGFTGEIEADTEVTGNITITDVSGPVTANSNTGKVEVIFNRVNQNSPISISTSTGEIDVSLPSDTPANFNLNSTTGNIYTNFDLNIPDKEGLRPVSSQKVTGSVNNGGVHIRLNSATGNIYLRKK